MLRFNAEKNAKDFTLSLASIATLAALATVLVIPPSRAAAQCGAGACLSPSGRFQTYQVYTYQPVQRVQFFQYAQVQSQAIPPQASQPQAVYRVRRGLFGRNYYVYEYLPSQVQTQSQQAGTPSPQAQAPATPQTPAKVTPQPQASTTGSGNAGSGDQYGFGSHLNYYRSLYRLAPITHDPNLSAWAATNNMYGFGHTIMVARRQNAAGNFGSAQAVAAAWMASPGHQAAMLDATITTYGIAYSPQMGCWTFNAN